MVFTISAPSARDTGCADLRRLADGWVVSQGIVSGSGILGMSLRVWTPHSLTERLQEVVGGEARVAEGSPRGRAWPLAPVPGVTSGRWRGAPALEQ